jgi:hypothetical protein
VGFDCFGEFVEMRPEMRALNIERPILRGGRLLVEVLEEPHRVLTPHAREFAHVKIDKRGSIDQLEDGVRGVGRCVDAIGEHDRIDSRSLPVSVFGVVDGAIDRTCAR